MNSLTTPANHAESKSHQSPLSRLMTSFSHRVLRLAKTPARGYKLAPFSRLRDPQLMDGDTEAICSKPPFDSTFRSFHQATLPPPARRVVDT